MQAYIVGIGCTRSVWNPMAQSMQNIDHQSNTIYSVTHADRIAAPARKYLITNITFPEPPVSAGVAAAVPSRISVEVALVEPVFVGVSSTVGETVELLPAFPPFLSLSFFETPVSKGGDSLLPSRPHFLIFSHPSSMIEVLAPCIK